MELAITSLGMVCSVGHDVRTACASIRAGISRPRPIVYHEILDPATQQAVPLVGYPLAGFAEGFNILGFWIRASLACLDDLVDFGKLPGPSDQAFWSKTALIAACPPMNDARFDGSDKMTDDFVKEAFLHRLLEAWPYPVARANLGIVGTSHAGAIIAIRRAVSFLTERGVDRAIVLAVDSLLDPMTLDWLAGNERLKTPDNPVGVMPGEAAACFLVEPRSGASARGAKVWAHIAPPGVGQETSSFSGGHLSQGVAMAGALREALAAPAHRPFQGPVIVDCNGEQWRAHEWGNARVRATDRLGAAITEVFPALSLGDTGAASAAIGVCLAVRALERGYAGHDSVLVAASSEQGHVGAVCLSKA